LLQELLKLVAIGTGLLNVESVLGVARPLPFCFLKWHKDFHITSPLAVFTFKHIN